MIYKTGAGKTMLKTLQVNLYLFVNTSQIKPVTNISQFFCQLLIVIYSADRSCRNKGKNKNVIPFPFLQLSCMTLCEEAKHLSDHPYNHAS